MDLAKDVYSLTKVFPEEESFGLTAQMRRAAVSVPSNIAEGAARSSPRDFIRFLYITLGSISELETQLLLSRELGFTDNRQMDKSIDEIRKMLIGLMENLRKRI